MSKTKVIVKDYPECNTQRSYPFMRVLSERGKILGDFYTLGMVKQSAVINDWEIVKIIHIKPAEKKLEEHNDDDD